MISQYIHPLIKAALLHTMKLINQSTIHRTMTIQEAQEHVDQWIKTHGVRYFNELTNMHYSRKKSAKWHASSAAVMANSLLKKSEDNTKTKLADELADVLFVLICIATKRVLT